ncbi:MAG: phosphocholine cytidylyltransferase family protein [Hyphomonas sp.]|uniref:phosphocholine cytidylyltransferase family protein n=1 Tax=Hyphomonas sp. TaxID=87 RepID=UPI003002B3D0
MCSCYKAVILAAGRGSRLGVRTENCPKALVQVSGKSLLDRALESLSSAGISEVIIVAGYLSEQLAPYTPILIENKEWESAGIFTSALAADAWLSEGDTIICYSDIFYSSEVVRSLCGSPYDIAIAYDPNAVDLWRQRFEDPLSDIENFQYDRSTSTLLAVGGRVSSLSDVEGQFMGLLKVTSHGWEQLRAAAASLPDFVRRDLDFTTLLSIMLENGHTIGVVQNTKAWGEVDHEADLLIYEKMNL